MAITQNTYTGNGSNKLFSISFEYLNPEDVDVYVNGTLQTITTQYFFANATTIEFVTAPANGATVLLKRTTDDTAYQATFFPGSSIKAQDLNDNFDQVLFIAQEATNTAATASSDSATALANSTTALSTANSADDKADVALNSVSSLIDYIPVLNNAALNALTPVNNNFYEVADSTGLEANSNVAGLPGGFVGSLGLSVRLKYLTSNSKYNFLSYYANDSETRYVKTSSGGTAAAPAYSFTGDTNTGVFRPSADTLGFSVNSGEAARIDSSGCLGVGNTSPASNALRGSFRTPNGTDSALPVVEIRRGNNAAGGAGNPEIGLDVQIPNTYNGASLAKGINVFANHNISTSPSYGVYSEIGGTPNGDPTTNAAGYFKATQSDTNGIGTPTAVFADANATIGASSSGYCIGVTSQTSNYVHNRNFQAISLYTGAGAQTVLGIARNNVAIGGITTLATATSYMTSASSGLLGVDATTVAIQTNNTEALRITSDKYLRMAASTGGIQFNGDTATANALDDYEEGTWTPSVGGNATYTVQSGRYTKVGRLVHLIGTIAINTLGTGSTQVISGLPFSSVGGVPESTGAVSSFQNLATSVTSINPYIPSGNTSVIAFYGKTGTASASNTIDLVTFTNSTLLYFSISYFTA